MYANLNAELARQNMTLIELSKKTGIKYATILRKLNGISPISLGEAKTIKNALGVDATLDELFEVKV